MNRLHTTFLALLLLALLVAACAAPTTDSSDPQAVEQAVAATLTAVAEGDDSAEPATAENRDPAPEPASAATDTPEPAEETGGETDTPDLVLPPQVTDFDDVFLSRPSVSMSERNARLFGHVVELDLCGQRRREQQSNRGGCRPGAEC